MNIKFKRMLSMLLVLMMVLSMVGPVTASASAYTAQYDKPIQIQVGERLLLQAPLWYARTTWSSSDKSVATVSQAGILTGIKAGEADITARSGKLLGFIGLERTTTYHVTVTETPEKVELHVGDKFQLTVPEKGGKTLWSSSAPKVAKVSSNGTVTALREGKATVTAKIMERSAWNWLRWYQSLEIEFQILVTAEPVESKPVIEEPVIALQTSDTLIYDEEENKYLLTGVMNTLSGTMSNSSNVTAASLKVEFSGQIVEVYTFSPAENWTVESFGVLPGENVLHFLLTDVNGDNWETDIILICDNEENIDAVIEDTSSDVDSDSIPDYIETLFGTDPDAEDTDQDGLSDDIEASILGCDARLSDTDADGILDGDEDPDEDGLTNLQEIAGGTDPCRFDSDGDMLADNEEVYTYQTNPLKIDTDDDGLDDSWEIDNGTNPLFADEIVTSEDHIQMGDCTAEVVVDLPGGLVQTLMVQASEEEILQVNIPGQLSLPVDLNLGGNLTASGATLSFQLDENYPAEVTEDFIPVIYYYNEERQLLEEIPTTYSNRIAQAHLEHFSTYILLNKVEFDILWEEDIRSPDDTSTGMTGLDIVFVIDSSGSMTSNDGSGLRITAAKEFVAKLGENDRAAVVDFDSYATLYQDFTSDHELLTAAIDRIDSSGGTNLSNGMNMAISQFTSESYTRTDAYKYIIFLTDGDGSYSSSYTTKASENGIIVYTIGLGSGVDSTLLNNIAKGTGGKYYFASSADGLLGIYDEVSFETVDYTTDSNGDGISDYHTRLIAKGALKNGIGSRYFSGAITKKILDLLPDCIDISEIIYQTIQSNADFDGDGLLNGEELVITTYGKQVYAKMISDPTMPNSDTDPFEDNLEARLEGSPFVFDILSSDLSWMINDDLYTASWSAKDFVDSGWYRFKLGLGNYIYGGEYDWSYAAQKQLLSSTEDYAQNLLDSYEALYLAENFITITNNFLSEVNNYMSAYVNIAQPATDASTIRDILGYMSELTEAKKELGKMDLSDMNKVREKCEDIGALYSKIDKSTAELSNIDFTQYDSINKISVKVPKWATKAAKSVDKVSKALTYITATVDSIDAISSTVSGYGALTATNQAYGVMYDVFKDLYKNSKISFVTIAAGELKLSVESQYIQMASKIKLSLEDVKYSWDEVGIDLVLAELGPVGWAVAIGRGLANLISGIGETSRQHIYMIAAGDAGNSSGRLLKKSMVETEDFYNETTDSSLDYMLICGTLRIAGEEKTIDSSDAQSWLYKKINDHDSVESFCQSQIEDVRRILKKYGLSV